MSPIAWEGLLRVAAAAGYLIASVGYGASLLLRHALLTRYARVATLLAVFLHTIAIGVQCAVTRQTPFTTPAQTISAVAWAVALAFLVLGTLRRASVTALGAVVLPAAFLCLFAGALLHHAPPGASASVASLLNSRLISLHVLAILFAFGLLILAFGCASLYLMQDRLLKRKRVAGGLFGKLPPLASIDHLAFSLVSFAFPLLTLGLAAGILRAATGGLPGGWEHDTKIMASFVTWLIYGVYLILHIVAHWRGPRANYLLVGGLIVTLLTLFAPTTHHSFG